MSAESPRRALSLRPLPLGAVGYVIPGEGGPVSVVSAQWSSGTVAVAVDGMYHALKDAQGEDVHGRSCKAS